MEIPGIPQSVDQSLIIEFLTRARIEISELQSIQIGYDSMTLRVYATKDEGKRFFMDDGRNVAIHEVTIPINIGE